MSSKEKRNGPKFGPGMQGMRGGEKAKDFKGTLGKLFKYLKPYYFKLVISNNFWLLASNCIFNCMDQKS